MDTCELSIFHLVFTYSIQKKRLYRGNRRLVNRWLFEILRLAFQDLRRDEEGTNSIYGREIGRVSFALLVLLTVPVLLSACLIAFWNIYMVEEQIGSSCSSSLDCFQFRMGKSCPVHNCSHWPPGTKYSYVRGLSATGGILFLVSAMLMVYTATLYNIQNVFCKWLCYCLVISGGCVLTLSFILLHTVIPHPTNAVFPATQLFVFFVAPITIAATTLIVVLLH